MKNRQVRQPFSLATLVRKSSFGLIKSDTAAYALLCILLAGLAVSAFVSFSQAQPSKMEPRQQVNFDNKKSHVGDEP